MRNKKIFYIVFFLVSACCIGLPIIVGIRIKEPNWFNKPPVWESKWLENPTCKPPCWENVLPGTTNRDGVKSTLTLNPKLINIEEREVIPYGLTMSVNIRDDKYKGNATIYFDDTDIAQVIELRFEEGAVNLYDIESYTGIGLYVDDLISTFGFPDQVLFIYWDYGYTKINLLYSDMFMIIEFAGYSFDQNNFSMSIQSYSEVSKLYLIGPNTKYPEFLEIASLRGSYKWKGYGRYP
jgi:hypothetical protein